MSGVGDGISSKFTAQKKVNKGDKVTVKFAISDVGDAGLDSYVFIEAGSLSFDAPGAKPNYANETLDELTPNATYVVSCGGETYTIIADESGRIPLSGTDQNGKGYNFIGKQISIYQKGEGDTGDSESKDVEIADRPKPSEPEVPTDTPADIDKNDVETTNNSITIKAVSGQEYRIGEDGDWISPDNAGNVVFDGLEGLKEYTIYTRVKATDGAPASLISNGVKATTKGMFNEQTITKTEYNGAYDDAEHMLKVETSVKDAVITYSDTLNGTYTSTPYSFKKSGTHTVYYCISKDNYYNAYGILTANIYHDKHILEYSAENNRLIATCTDETCEYHQTGVSLTLNVPVKTIYSGEEVTASYGAGEAEAWKAVTGTDAPTIRYEYKAVENGTYASTTDTKNAGFYRATATCGGETASVEFEIEQKEITANDVVLDKEVFFVATDGTTAQSPILTVNSDGNLLAQVRDYTVSGDTSNVFAGSYTLVVEGTGNYKGTVKKTWKIEKNPQIISRPTISNANILATQVIVDEYAGGAGDVTYAISATNEAPVAGWQISNVFSGLNPETAYYVFVRCAGNAIYYPATSAGTIFTTNAIADVDVNGITEVDGIDNPGITYDGASVTVEDIIKGNPSVDETPFTVAYKYIDAENGEELLSAPTNAGSYKLVITVKSANTTATKEIAFKIKNAEQPEIDAKTIVANPTTIYGKKDGKITGLTSEYEYSTDGGDSYISCDGTELSGLGGGTVKIRRKAKPNYDASESVDVVIKEGNKIHIQVPDIKNCTITASPSEVAYNESTTITIKPDPGYKVAEPLKAVIGGVERTFVKDAEGNYTCTISGIKKMDALKVTDVSGVAEKEYEDVSPEENVINDITNSKDSVAETNTFAAEIKNNSELEKLLDVTPQEKMQGVNIWLKVVDASATAPKADKAVIENAKNDFNVGMILDVSLFKKVGDQETQKITNTNGMTKISVLVPEELRKSGRMYEIIRVHNGVATVILPALDAESYTLTFETDQFSTYAIMYKDADQTKVEEAPNTQVANKIQNVPATGDSFDPVIWIAVMGIALLAILGMLNKRYKETQKEEKDRK